MKRMKLLGHTTIANVYRLVKSRLPGFDKKRQIAKIVNMTIKQTQNNSAHF